MRKTIFKPRTLMHRFGWIAAILLLAAIPAIAQDADSDMPQIPPALAKRLAAHASKIDEVTLNKNMLNFGGQFLNNNDKDDRQAQQVIHNLNGIYVRDYKFDQPGAYTQADLEAIRRIFIGPQWKPMVHTSSVKEGKTTDIYMKMVDGKTDGMFILDAKPDKLSLVYISGSIDPKDLGALGALGGNFGVPNVPKSPKPPESPK